MITLPRNPLRGRSGPPDTAPPSGDPGRKPPQGKDAARSRRRFARRQWLRRWLVWRYVIGSVLLVLAAVTTIWLVFFSSLLTVQHVDLQLHRTAQSPLTQQEVLAAAAVPQGAHLAQLDVGAIRSRVAALAPVRSVDVSRQWPDGVLIEVTARTPVAAVDIDGHYHAMDSQGVLFRPYRRPPADLPRVDTPADTQSSALAESARVIAALPPSLAARVDHVQVLSIDRISLVLHSGQSVIWGNSSQSALKAEVLARLLTRPAHTYDVSVPGQPVTTG